MRDTARLLTLSLVLFACSKENNIVTNLGAAGGAAGKGPDCAEDGTPTEPPASYKPCMDPTPSESCPSEFGEEYRARVTCVGGGKPPAAACCLQKDVDDWCCPVPLLCTAKGQATTTVGDFAPCETPSANPTCVDTGGGVRGLGTMCPTGKVPPAAACCVKQAGDFWCCSGK